MSNLITNSMLGTGKLCMRKLFYNHRMRLTPKVRSVPLRRGDATHVALEGFYKDKITDAKELSKRAIERYREGLDFAAPYMSETDQQRMSKEEAIVAGLPYGYVDVYNDDHDKWEIIACEAQVRTRIPHPDVPDLFSPWDYGAVLDLVVRERDTQDYVLVEHKTTSKLDSVYLRKLEIDPQLSGYWLSAHAYRWPIKKVIYNVIRMPTIRQRQTETRTQFIRRLQEEFVASPDKYFYRHEVTRTREQLEQFLRGVWEWATYLEYMWDRPMDSWLRSDPQACTMYNRMCEFLGPCAHGLDGPHMLEYVTRTQQHPEYEEV